MAESLLIGWIAIHRLFCDEEGNPVIALNTLQQSYGPELKELGIVFRYKIGKSKRPSVAAWPSKIRNWWTLKQQQKWMEKNPARE